MKTDIHHYTLYIDESEIRILTNFAHLNENTGQPPFLFLVRH